jgi:hypothetical protein
MTASNEGMEGVKKGWTSATRSGLALQEGIEM